MELFGTYVLYGYFGMWSWPFTMISFNVVLWGLFIGFFIDIFSGDPAMWNTYPNIYDNFVAQIYLETVDPTFQLGPYKFYDQFSINGALTYKLDLFIFVFVPYYWLFNLIMRAILDDWNWNRGYFFLNSVDPNRFINWDWFPADPYDYEYWST